jgi:hypothetical protein
MANFAFAFSAAIAEALSSAASSSFFVSAAFTAASILA